MNDEMLVMVLFHRESNRKLDLNNMYLNNKPLLQQYWVREVMMTNMECSLVWLEYRIMLDRRVKLMMMDMDQVLFEKLQQKTSYVISLFDCKCVISPE